MNEIEQLLTELETASSDRKRKIRAQLRRLGHKGGLHGAPSSEPIVAVIRKADSLTTAKEVFMSIFDNESLSTVKISNQFFGGDGAKARDVIHRLKTRGLIIGDPKAWMCVNGADRVTTQHAVAEFHLTMGY